MTAGHEEEDEAVRSYGTAGKDNTPVHGDRSAGDDPMSPIEQATTPRGGPEEPTDCRTAAGVPQTDGGVRDAGADARDPLVAEPDTGGECAADAGAGGADTAGPGVADSCAADPAAGGPNVVSTGADGPAATPVPGGRSRRMAAIVLATAVLAGLAGAALVGAGLLADRRQVEHERAAVAAAREAVTNLTTISARDAERDLDRLLASTTGSFHEEFARSREAFLAAVHEGRVTTTGEVGEAGFERWDGDGARVLVAARAEIRSGDQEQESRGYRLAVGVQEVDGRWMASSIDFVP